jgi:hypothetical protein
MPSFVSPFSKIMGTGTRPSQLELHGEEPAGKQQVQGEMADEDRSVGGLGLSSLKHGVIKRLRPGI